MIEKNSRAGDTSVACFLDEKQAKSIFTERFSSCSCHMAFPDQLHTFVGDCSSIRQIVVAVPKGDIRFGASQYKGMNIIASIGEEVSADYLDFLEDMQISYIFAGSEGNDMELLTARLRHEFGIDRLEAPTASGSAEDPLLTV